ncbi:hypothetical protein DPMN_012773 [Dreissena polymorpha]|uniref:Uncharacterized protein n=1 Tax=Dreissena polymorpha TaxID=45954 RepID=A0A9D4S349_DREPO|nr:hypothetical protein DPMN_012773 [Dreissena polymorpha]
MTKSRRRGGFSTSRSYSRGQLLLTHRLLASYKRSANQVLHSHKGSAAPTSNRRTAN